MNTESLSGQADDRSARFPLGSANRVRRWSATHCGRLSRRRHFKTKLSFSLQLTGIDRNRNCFR